jgi:pSer/pThr/pTyr-binding forkhead associated (FHA) protein
LFAENALSLDGSISNLSSDLSLPNDRTIKISVITGPSTGFTHRLTKAKTSIGQVGGSADIEIDDPQISVLHCVIGVANDMVRLCDLDSANGTYVNGERVQTVELEHLSEFRVGSTWLIVTIVPTHFMDSTSF